MKRAVAAAAALLMMTACGSDNNNPDGPSNTGPIVFSVQMSALNEFPALAASNPEINARGTATITMNVTRDQATGAVTGGGTIDFSVQVNGFPNGTQLTAAHIHPGAAGTSGGVRISTGLSAADNVIAANGSTSFTKSTSISQTDATEIAANPANFYFNVHTLTNSGGAVRGQLTRQ